MAELCSISQVRQIQVCLHERLLGEVLRICKIAYPMITQTIHRGFVFSDKH